MYANIYNTFVYIELKYFSLEIIALAVYFFVILSFRLKGIRFPQVCLNIHQVTAHKQTEDTNSRETLLIKRKINSSNKEGLGKTNAATLPLIIIRRCADAQTLLSCLQICKNDMILQWLHIHFPSWQALSVSICHRLLCPIIWLALNTPALRELSCVPPCRAIHKQSHYNMYSHISNNKTDGHCACRLICFPHEWWGKKKRRSILCELCLMLTVFFFFF